MTTHQVEELTRDELFALRDRARSAHLSQEEQTRIIELGDKIATTNLVLYGGNLTDASKAMVLDPERKTLPQHVEAVIMYHGKLTDEQIRSVVFRTYDPESDRNSVYSAVAEMNQTLPEDIVRAFVSGEYGSYPQEVILSNEGMPQDLIDELATNPPTQWAVTQLAYNPQLRPKGVHKLKILLAVPRKVRMRGIEDMLPNPAWYPTQKLLAKARGKVRPDFWEMFASTWEGSLDEFIEYAQALDN